jgi:hypothetical protein
MVYELGRLSDRGDESGEGTQVLLGPPSPQDYDTFSACPSGELAGEARLSYSRIAGEHDDSGARQARRIQVLEYLAATYERMTPTTHRVDRSVGKEDTHVGARSDHARRMKWAGQVVIRRGRSQEGGPVDSLESQRIREKRHRGEARKSAPPSFEGGHTIGADTCPLG